MGTTTQRFITTLKRNGITLSSDYQAYFATFKADLPPGLRHIDDSYYLHDAKVLGMGRRDRSFVIVLQLDPPPHSLLTFTFDLLAEPVINKSALPKEHCTPDIVTEWQYDELERVPGEPCTWRQSILFSNGWEVELHFRDVEVREAEALLPCHRSHG